MKISTLVSTALLLGTSGSALAGGFVGLGIGSESRMDDGSGRFSSDGRSGKLFGGYQYPLAVGRIGAEASYTGYSLDRVGTTFDGRSIALAGRYNYPIADGFEVFGRLGIQHTSLDANGMTMAGAGPLLSAGFEYHLPLKLPVNLAVYVDLSYLSQTLESTDSRGQVFEADADDRMVSLGVVVGF